MAKILINTNILSINSQLGESDELHKEYNPSNFIEMLFQLATRPFVQKIAF